MKTFTVTDLKQKLGTLLDICDKEASIRIRRRNGRSYVIRREPSDWSKVSRRGHRRWIDEHVGWLRRTFPMPISKEQTAMVDRLISSE
jgi:hypothetical protein